MGQGRIATAAAVLLLLAGIHALAPDPPRRGAWLLLLALPLGYGHLIGGALAARSARPASAPRTLARAAAALSGFAAYTGLLGSAALRPWVLASLLGVSAWHIVENDRALARLGPQETRLGPLRLSVGECAPVAAATALLALLALGTAVGRQWTFLLTGLALPALPGPSLEELMAAVLLYHALSFLGFALRRTRRRRGWRAARLRRQLWLSHALPLGANALCYCWLDAIHALAASPALYLYWSVLHAASGARRRGLQR